MSDHKERYERGEIDTTSGREPRHFGAPAPEPEVDSRGMHPSYWVLSDSERAKGFVRPVRNSYRHEKCGTTTTMGRKLAETYAAQPSFYGSTYCVNCGGHFPVGEHGEFTWEGTGEKVGTWKRVNGMADATVIEPIEAVTNSDSPRGKAFIRIAAKDEDGRDVVVNFTLNTLGMLGGMAKGVASRFGYEWY